MKILFAGAIEQPGMSGWQRLQALKFLGHDITTVSLLNSIREQPYWDWLKKRVLSLEQYEQILEKRAQDCSSSVLNAAVHGQPDLVWLEWPRLITAETIQEIKKRLPCCTVVSFQDDNPFGTRSHVTFGWSRFLRALPYYDFHLVKRISDVEEYSRRGAKQVQVFTSGYSEDLFYPERERCSQAFSVAFVGTALDHRIEFLEELTGRLGMEVSVFGDRWNRTSVYRKRKKLFHPAVWGDEYRSVLWRSKIALGFVSSSNLDEWTMRTFEIPACGTFFLAQRTPAHQQLFEEGTEAEYFESPEECRDKTLFYLTHESAREQVASRGHLRCIRSRYGLRHRMEDALQMVCPVMCT